MKLLKTELYRFQRRISAQALEEEAFALFMEQGTGKTITALKIAAVRWRRHSVRLVLVVGPKNVIGGWERQITRHLSIPCDVFTGKRGLLKMKEGEYSKDRLTFLVINYEQVWRNLKLLIKLGWHMVIADEGHRMRRRNSRQSKAMGKLGTVAQYKLLLTGTPIGKDEQDLWAQMRFLDPDILGDKWTKFEKRYLRKTRIIGNSGQEWFKVRFRPGMKDRMLKRIAPFTARVTAREVFKDLPPATDEAIYFDLSRKARKAYDDLERDFVHEFGGLTSTTPLALTKMVRLQQLTGGFLGMDDGSLLQLEQDKLVMLADWLEDIPTDEKIVIFAKHTSEIDMLAQLMRKTKRTFVIRDGRTKRRDLNAWMDFQDKPHPKVYLSQIASGGIGTDLFAARYGVFYSKGFSLIDYEQARKRIDRNGQTRPVLFVHMMARNTIDEDLMDSLNAGGLTADGILRRLQLRHTSLLKRN